MNRFFFLSTALFIATGVAGAAGVSHRAYAGSGTSCEHYSGHASVEGKWGSERSITETSAFVPIACREDRLLYGDVRLKADNRGNREGNVGVGLRELKENGVAGGYVYLDRRRSGATEKLFTQTTLGAEWLAEDWEVRGNAYVPLSGKKQMGTSGGEALSDPYLAGSGIYVDVAGRNAVVEKPLWGADAEVGLKLPGRDFWMHAGAFAFDASEVEGLAGGRLRATYKVTDRIALTAEGQYDNVRGRQGWLGVRYTIPFGDSKTKHTGLKHRMTVDPVRDVDIVTAAVEEQVTPAHAAPVENTSTETAQRVIHVDNSAGGGGDGTLENPFNTLAAAQAILQDFDILYINRGTGTSAGMNAGLSVTHNNVWVIGSGTAFVYDAGRFYAPVEENFSGTVLAAAAAAPVITNAGGNGDGISVTGANAWIGGVTVSGAARNGIYALSSAGTDLGDITISDVTVTGNTGSGIVIETGAGSSFGTASIMDATTSGNAGRGIYALVQAGGDIENITLSDIISNNNTGAAGRGIELSISGAGSTVNTATLNDIATSSNAGIGTIVNVQINSHLSTLNMNSVSSNADASRGIYLRAEAGGNIDNITADNTTVTNTSGTGRGMEIIASGAGSTISSAIVENSIFNNNASVGLLVQATNSGVVSDAFIRGNNTSNNAAGVGAQVMAEISGLISNVEISDLTTNANGNRGLYVISRTSGDMGTVTLEGITANNNSGADGRGIEVTATDAGSTISNVTMTETAMSGNAQQGALVQASTNASIGTVDVEDMTSTGNLGADGRGLQLLVGSGSSITTTEITDSTFTGNAAEGLYITPLNGGFLDEITIADITASANNSRGVHILVQGGSDVNTISADNITALNNTGANGRGMEIGIAGAGSTINSAAVSDSTFTGNNGVGLYLLGTGGGLVNSASFSDVTASGNANTGINVTLTSGADLGTLDIDGATVSGNTTASGRGIYVEVTGAGSTLTTANISNVAASSNGASGLFVTSASNGLVSTLNVSNVSSNQDDSRGIYLLAQTGGDIGTITADNLTATNIGGAAGRGMEIIANGAGSVITSSTVTNSTFNTNASIGFLYQAINSGVFTAAAINNSSAAANTGRGIYILAQADGDYGTVSLDNITVQNNTGAGGYGVQFLVTGAGSTVNSATLDNITASGNGQPGVYGGATTSGLISSLSISGANVTTSGFSGGIVVDANASAITSVDISDSTSSGNTTRGVYVIAQGNGDIDALTVDNVTAQNNTGASGIGLNIVATGAGSTVVNSTVRNSTFSGNAQQGYFANATIANGFTNVVLEDTSSTGNTLQGAYVLLQNASANSVTIDNLTSTGNTDATSGRGLEIAAINSALTTLTLRDSNISGNASNGTYTRSATNGLIGTFDIDNTVMSGNVGRGALIQTQSGGDYGTITIDGLTAQNNTGVNGHGLQLQIDAANSVLTSATISGSSIFSGNAQSGVYLQATNTSTVSGINIHNITSTGNGASGIYFDDDTINPYVVDMGGGALGSTGNNRIFDNTGAELRVDLDGGELKAENNWWGVGTGLAGGEVTLEVNSTVDSTPFLATDPGP
ncbi:MAG: hypothetical protein DYH13_09205 [Alphaproteobacteria bacterium PRO2]|nr:hypothetical protein [Alphaproteobacteria bacterium PRO2]